MIELRPRTNRLDFSTDPGPIWIQDQLFHFSITERWGVFGIKYELKELQMNVHDSFGGIGLRIKNNGLVFWNSSGSGSDNISGC